VRGFGRVMPVATIVMGASCEGDEAAASVGDG